MSLSLTQSLTSAQTIFALFVYCMCVMISLPVFETIHEKLEHDFPQFLWDKIGMPVLRTLLLLLFLVLVYPLNFGITEAPALAALFGADKGRFDFLFNMLFLITFVYPVIPIIGKVDALMIPVQSMIASMILFRWLCLNVEHHHYSLLPDLSTFAAIILLAIFGYLLARYIAIHLGAWLDETFHRDGYAILVFQGVLMIMQSPVIFIYGHALGQQLASGN